MNDQNPNSDKLAQDLNELQDAHVDDICKKMAETVQRHKDVRTVLAFKKKPALTETLISETADAGAA